MPQRNVRKTAILVKLETTYGTDSVPTGGANAMLISNQSVNPLAANNVDRALVRPFMGRSEQLVGTRYKEVSFDVELVGSGTAGTAPAWGPCLRACAHAEVVSAGTRVDYVRITDNLESATIYYFDDGIRHILLGARGTVQINAGIGQRPVLSFRFQGIDGGDAAASLPSVTLSAFQVPQAVTDQNTADVTVGATHSLSGAPALVGGTVYPSAGLELDAGLSVNFTPMLGQETVDITDAQATGRVTFDLTAAQEVSFMDDIRAATVRSVGLVHGTVTGRRVLLWMPAVQLVNPTKTDINGKRVQSYDMNILPSAGNDELRIVCF